MAFGLSLAFLGRQRFTCPNASPVFAGVYESLSLRLAGQDCALQPHPWFSSRELIPRPWLVYSDQVFRTGVRTTVPVSTLEVYRD